MLATYMTAVQISRLLKPHAGLIRLVNSSLEGLMDIFGDYLTGSEYMVG